MKKVVIYSLIMIIVCSFYNVEATSGRLRKDSIKTCNGVRYGKHGSDNHWHVADYDGGYYYANGDPIYKDPCANSSSSSGSSSSSSSSSKNNSKPGSASSSSNKNSSSSVTTTKSRDNTIKSLKVDDTSVEFDETNNAKINTSENKLNLKVTLNDNKAKYEIQGNKDFKPGDNEVKIIVTSESGSKKTYIISVYRKNNDNSLKSISVFGNSIEVSDNMEFTTTKSKLNCEIMTNDEKAKYEIIGNKSLVLGVNELTIKVTAEDETTKDYFLKITRERILSSDVGVKVIIDGEIVEFENYSATVYINSNENSIDFKYTLSSEKAIAEVKEVKEFKTGNNEMHLIVTAEDGTKQDYTIIVYKYSKIEDIIYSILGWGIIGGIGYGIFKLIKKFKK